MKCPHCGHSEARVLETRVQKVGDIKRRRECSQCRGRFSTLEVVLCQLPHVVKRDGVSEPFNKEKLKNGIQLACLKRPVSLAQIEEISERIAQVVQDKNEKAISSVDIGTLVMKELKNVDDVAYVRFASVYRTFQDVQEFVATLEEDVAGKELKT